jgi:parvulin-like peptidyl-prolyl isomerase
MLIVVIGCQKQSDEKKQENNTEKSVEQIEQSKKESEVKITTVATVNGEEITSKDVDDFFKRDPSINQAIEQSENPRDKEREIRGQIVNFLIDRKLMLQAAKKYTPISDSEAEEGLRSYLAMYGGEENLKKVLANAGVPFGEFTTGIKEDMVVKKFLKTQVSDQVKVTEGELNQEFKKNKAKYAEPEQVRAKHILISVKPGRTEAAAKEKIKEIQAEINSGKVSFEEAAKRDSDCPSKERGGDLGFFVREQMVPEFSEVAFSTEVGKVSEPVQTQFGFHLIKVEEKKKAKEAVLENVKDKVEADVKQRKEETLLQELLKKLRAEGSIVVR